MGKLIWEDKYKTGIDIVDKEHQRLFEIFNMIYDSLFKQQIQILDLQRNFNQLIDYTIYHFGHEEEKMKSLGYSKFEEHKKEHDNLIGQVHEFEKKIRSNTKEIDPMSVLNFLIKWLVDHILDADKEFGVFYQAKQSRK